MAEKTQSKRSKKIKLDGLEIKKPTSKAVETNRLLSSWTVHFEVSVYIYPLELPPFDQIKNGWS